MGTKNKTSATTSIRLRLTLEIARLAGFPYQENKKNQWGGFFNVCQLEILESKLQELRAFKRFASITTTSEEKLVMKVNEK